MSRIQYFCASSLDGFIAAPGDQMEWLHQFADVPGKADYYDRFLADVGCLAMGSRTYEFILGLGEAWPYGDRPTWVFSRRRLPRIDGADLRFATGEVGREVSGMREAADGRNIWVVGGGDLAAQFVADDLLDELWLGLAPVVLGSGTPVLPVRRDAAWSLDEVVALGDFVKLRYTAPGHANPGVA
ncbi:MAG: dihydrofolate reductase family protein [Actinomycetota bacterium]|nr:dihydrofolate reductase family protein [Actinomycetota bacterium]